MHSIITATAKLRLIYIYISDWCSAESQTGRLVTQNTTPVSQILFFPVKPFGKAHCVRPVLKDGRELLRGKASFPQGTKAAPKGGVKQNREMDCQPKEDQMRRVSRGRG